MRLLIALSCVLVIFFGYLALRNDILANYMGIEDSVESEGDIGWFLSMTMFLGLFFIGILIIQMAVHVD